MRFLFVAASAVLLTGCLATSQDGPKTAAAPEPGDKALNQTGCYTVDLFKPIRIQRAPKSVPAEHRAFLGEWTEGSWNGEWCHDLLIYKIAKGGEVEMLELHGPSQVYYSAPSAFKRKGRITEEGVLRYAYGTEIHEYRILPDGRLSATRSGGYRGQLNAILTPKNFAPIPVPRPVRLAKRPGPQETADE